MDYLADDAGKLRGVAVHDGTTHREEIGANLVVDATGRATRTPA